MVRQGVVTLWKVEETKNQKLLCFFFWLFKKQNVNNTDHISNYVTSVALHCEWHSELMKYAFRIWTLLSNPARQSLLSLTNGWTFDTCLSCFTIILLVNEKKKNQPTIYVRTTCKELVVKHSPTFCCFFSQINFTDWNLIRVAIHIDFTICLFAWLCFKEWNGLRNLH